MEWTRGGIIRALEGMKVETGSLICLGCAYEDHCSTRGCAVMREAKETLLTLAVENQALRNAANSYKAEAQRCAWISVEERLPEEDGLVLAIVNGWPVKNVELQDAYELARYTPAEGWILETWPEWEGADVRWWAKLHEPPEEGFIMRRLMKQV